MLNFYFYFYFNQPISYDYVVRLHMLSDAERVGRILESGLVDDGHVAETMRVLDDRLETVEASMHSKQPLLALYRVLIPLLGKSTSKYEILFRFFSICWFREVYSMFASIFLEILRLCKLKFSKKKGLLYF